MVEPEAADQRRLAFAESSIDCFSFAEAAQRPAVGSFGGLFAEGKSSAAYLVLQLRSSE